MKLLTEVYKLPKLRAQGDFLLRGSVLYPLPHNVMLPEQTAGRPPKASWPVEGIPGAAQRLLTCTLAARSPQQSLIAVDATSPHISVQ